LAAAAVAGAGVLSATPPAMAATALKPINLEIMTSSL